MNLIKVLELINQIKTRQHVHAIEDEIMRGSLIQELNYIMCPDDVNIPGGYYYRITKAFDVSITGGHDEVNHRIDFIQGTALRGYYPEWDRVNELSE